AARVEPVAPVGPPAPVVRAEPAAPAGPDFAKIENTHATLRDVSSLADAPSRYAARGKVHSFSVMAPR
ncbi:hypothetical protein QHF83_44335, partial [Polyangium sp. 15x6]